MSIGAIIIIAIAVSGVLLMRFRKRWLARISVRSLCWEINQFMGVANDEDRGFKRHGEMLAARPLNRIFECFCEEADNEHVGRGDRDDDQA